MIKTTVYSDGIISEGCYYDNKGFNQTFEFIGSALEYMHLIDNMKTQDYELDIALIRVNAPAFITPVFTEFSLHNVWKMNPNESDSFAV